jgi:predicted membrane protein
MRLKLGTFNFSLPFFLWPRFFMIFTTVGTAWFEICVNIVCYFYLQTMEESRYVQRGKEMAEEVSKTVERAAESVSKQSESIAQSNIFQSVSQVWHT